MCVRNEVLIVWMVVFELSFVVSSGQVILSLHSHIARIRRYVFVSVALWFDCLCCFLYSSSWSVFDSVAMMSAPNTYD